MFTTDYLNGLICSDLCDIIQLLLMYVHWINIFGFLFMIPLLLYEREGGCHLYATSTDKLQSRVSTTAAEPNVSNHKISQNSWSPLIIRMGYITRMCGALLLYDCVQQKIRNFCAVHSHATII